MHRMMQTEREKRGWSRQDVAKEVGLSVEAIRLIESGQRNPSYEVLVKLEDLFRMNHRELMAQSK